MSADGQVPGDAATQPRELIADYLEHLGPGDTREVLRHIAANAEALLDRIAAAIDGIEVGAGDRPFRRIAHDIVGTLGSLGLAADVAMAQAIETAPPDIGQEELRRLARPLLAARGQIAGSVMAILDDLLAETGVEDGARFEEKP